MVHRKMVFILAILILTIGPIFGASAVVAVQQQPVSQSAAVVITDIEKLEPVVLPKPSFQYYLDPSVKLGEVKAKKLTLTKKQVKKVPSVEFYDETAAFEANEYHVPNPLRNLKGNVPDGVPTMYKGQMLVRAVKGKDNLFLVYGRDFGTNRYLVVMDKKHQQFLFAYDFIHYAYAPKYIKSDYDYIYQETNWMVIDNGILYVSHGHRTYAKSSSGMNAYITAIRLSDNAVIWRSTPLVSNTANFEIIGNVIVTGYGFTAEKDYLYQLDKRTGKTLDKVLLKDGPEYIVRTKNSLFVHGYSVTTEFQYK